MHLCIAIQNVYRLALFFLRFQPLWYRRILRDAKSEGKHDRECERFTCLVGSFEIDALLTEHFLECFNYNCNLNKISFYLVMEMNRLFS